MAKFCSHCGNEVHESAVVCIRCGCAIPQSSNINSANTSSYTSLICGIIGIIMAWFFALIGHILSIVGICLGVKEYKATGKLSGLVTSIIGEVCAIISSVIGVMLASGL